MDLRRKSVWIVAAVISHYVFADTCTADGPRLIQSGIMTYDMVIVVEQPP